MAAKKIHVPVSYRESHELTKEVCDQVIKAGYTPEYIIAIGTGGYVPGRVAKTCFEKRLGIENLPLHSVGYTNYNENNERLPEPIRTQCLDEDLEKKVRCTKVLLVDEVDDSRRTLRDASLYLLENVGVKELRIIVLHSKYDGEKADLPAGVKLYYAKKVPKNWWMDYDWEEEEPYVEDLVAVAETKTL